MSSPTLLLRNGKIVTPERIHLADVAVADGRIAAIGAGLAGPHDLVMDIDGQYLIPGIIDAHVHFNEPGRTEWEGLETGSSAFAAGGGAVFFDMPLNSEPPVTDAERFAEKRRLAEAKSRTDFALWGGLVPGNLDRLEELKEAGTVGLKAFMCPSGIDTFPGLDGDPLRRGMEKAARLDLLVAVHAEDGARAAQLAAAARARGDTSARAYLDSRPVEVELAAIGRALEYAGETGCRLHIVHISSPEGLEKVAEAKRRGVDVSAETCPHYLLLTDRDVERMGAVAKCAPPLRDEKRRQALWSAFRGGKVDLIGSDHSPSPPSLKTSADFFAIWGGIAGIQHAASLLFSETADSPDQEWPRLVAALSAHVAKRFRLPARKGRLAEGCDADFAVVSIHPSEPILERDLLTRHRLSPYVGLGSRVRVVQTFVRGQAIHPRAGPAPRGQFLRPEPARP